MLAASGPKTVQKRQNFRLRRKKPREKAKKNPNLKIINVAIFLLGLDLKIKNVQIINHANN